MKNTLKNNNDHTLKKNKKQTHEVFHLTKGLIDLEPHSQG